MLGTIECTMNKKQDTVKKHPSVEIMFPDKKIPKQDFLRDLEIVANYI